MTSLSVATGLCSGNGD